MLFLGELVSYLIKFVALAAIAVAGVLCGAHFAKKKKENVAENVQTTEE